MLFAVSLGLLSVDDAPAEPASVLSYREADAIGQAIAQQGGFVYYCKGDSVGRWIEVAGIQTRRSGGSAELLVNGHRIDAGCVYLPDDAVFVNALQRLRRGPKSQPDLLARALLPSEARLPDARAVATAVFEESNLARTDPAAYARYLEEQLPYYRGRKLARPDRTVVLTVEGREAVEEAIRFLRNAPAVKALRWSDVLSSAALDHVKDQGPRGAIGHTGSGGFTLERRLQRRGVNYRLAAENISYGHREAREIVLSLIVDDGVRDRGHRANLFLPNVDAMGVGCGPHKGYGWMCVQDLVQSR